MEETGEVRLGGYVVRIEEDVFLVRAGGEVTVEIAQGLVRLVRQVYTRHGRFFIIGDLKDAGPMPPSSRRIFLEFGIEHSPLAVAFFHVNLIARGVNALLFAAANLLGKKRQNMKQFSTEEEARTWIAAERRRLLASQ